MPTSSSLGIGMALTPLRISASTPGAILQPQPPPCDRLVRRGCVTTLLLARSHSTLGRIDQINADSWLPLLVHRAGSLDESIALGRSELNNGHAQGRDFLQQRLTRLVQTLAGNHGFLLTAVGGGALDAGEQETVIARKGLDEPGQPLLKEIAALGVTIIQLTAAERDAFVKATRPVYQKWKPTIGVDLVNAAESAVAARKK